MTIAAATDKLAVLPGDRLVASREVSGRHGQNVTCRPATPTDAVAFPKTTDQVLAILKLYKVEHYSVAPSGAALPQEDRHLCRAGGKSLGVVPMNTVFQDSAEDLTEFSEPPQGNLKDASDSLPTALLGTLVQVHRCEIRL